jgi:hypothetical protein
MNRDVDVYSGACQLACSGFCLPSVIADQGDRARLHLLHRPAPQRQHPRHLPSQRPALLRMGPAQGPRLSDTKSYHVSGYLAQLTVTGKDQLASTPHVGPRLVARREALCDSDNPLIIL